LGLLDVIAPGIFTLIYFLFALGFFITAINTVYRKSQKTINRKYACNDCGHRVSRSTRSCPACGNRFRLIRIAERYGLDDMVGFLCVFFLFSSLGIYALYSFIKALKVFSVL
jgi:DNA-directed RNA polymerase subunit RPC12/RpoP